MNEDSFLNSPFFISNMNYKTKRLNTDVTKSKVDKISLNDSKINLSSANISPPNFFRPWNADIRDETLVENSIEEPEEEQFDKDDKNKKLSLVKNIEKIHRSNSIDMRKNMIKTVVLSPVKIHLDPNDAPTLILDDKNDIYDNDFIVTDLHLNGLLEDFKINKANKTDRKSIFLSKNALILVSPKKMTKREKKEKDKKDLKKGGIKDRKGSVFNVKEVIQAEQASVYKEKNSDFVSKHKNIETSKILKDLPIQSSSASSIKTEEMRYLYMKYQASKKEAYEKKKKEKTDCFCFNL